MAALSRGRPPARPGSRRPRSASWVSVAPVRSAAMPRTFWVETLGCPKNQVDSDKLGGLLAADGLTAASGGGCGRRGGGQHVRVRGGRPTGVDRHRPGPQRGPRPGAQVVLTGCLAERYGEELAAALPEVTVAGFGQAVLAPDATPVGVAAPPVAARPGWRCRSRPSRPRGVRRSTVRAAPPAATAPVGLPEGGRGMRSCLRVLCHPLLPGRPAQPVAWTSLLAEVDQLRVPRGGAGGPGPGLLWP